ncbi:MAG: hypothetical protein ACI9TA_001874 [Reinekea sp.]|jgi:hypothetical protein
MPNFQFGSARSSPMWRALRTHPSARARLIITLIVCIYRTPYAARVRPETVLDSFRDGLSPLGSGAAGN